MCEETFFSGSNVKAEFNVMKQWNKNKGPLVIGLIVSFNDALVFVFILCLVSVKRLLWCR